MGPQTDSESSNETRNVRKDLAWGAFGVLALIALGLYWLVSSVQEHESEERGPGPLEQSAETCGPSATYSKSSRSVSVSGNEELDLLAVRCVLNETGAPERVWQDVQSTAAMHGNRTDEYMGYVASWNYHGERGVDFILQVDR